MTVIHYDKFDCRYVQACAITCSLGFIDIALFTAKFPTVLIRLCVRKRLEQIGVGELHTGLEDSVCFAPTLNELLARICEAASKLFYNDTHTSYFLVIDAGLENKAMDCSESELRA